MEVDRIGVHTSHCCLKHGCKYGYDVYEAFDENGKVIECPVSSGKLPQKYACEDCYYERGQFFVANAFDGLKELEAYVTDYLLLAGRMECGDEIEHLKMVADKLVVTFVGDADKLKRTQFIDVQDLEKAVKNFAI